MPQQNQNNNLYWYKDAIIYELHIKAFRDSNNDGIGDIPALLEKLDYLKDLGVTAIWVLPFYPSPLRDDGYDIADYYRINPAYGDINQFKKLLNEAHKRDLKVITELVINHTSDQHPWFQAARRAQELKDVAVATEVIDREQLRSALRAEVADIARGTAGLHVSLTGTLARYDSAATLAVAQ